MATPTTPKKPSTRASKPVAAPTPDEIAERAHQIFIARGSENGHDLEDWLEAESQLLNERSVKRKPRNGAPATPERP